MKYNLSKTYLLPLISPLIGIEKNYLDLLENTYLLEDTYKYKDCFLILHKMSFKLPEITSYEHRLVDNNYFQELIDIDNETVLYIYKFPKEYLKEYYLFINGKYSQFGKDAKDEIISYWTKMYGRSMEGVNFILKVKHILNKSETLRIKMEKDLNVKISPDSELGQLINIDNETFSLNEKIRNKNKVGG